MNNSKNIKPTKCCAVGSYDCQTHMPLNGRLQSIDFCISDIVAALNACNIKTVASCCGHDKFKASILLEDGREIEIHNVTRFWENNKQK